MQDSSRTRAASRPARSSIYPLIKEGIIHPDTVIIDAKSGTTGAGRGAKVRISTVRSMRPIKAYGVAVHRHTPEIEFQLSIAAGRPILVQFTPHLVPMVTAASSLTAYRLSRRRPPTKR